MYPEQIYKWKTFHEDVNDHKIDNPERIRGNFRRIFSESLARANVMECYDEDCEELCLRANLSVLVKSGILHEDQSKKGAKGRPDFCFATEDNNKFTMFCECKSTQNLLLPKTADECVTIYNKAFNDVKASRKRTTGWHRVNHPVAQLIGYMVDNRCRYGVLTSGTRSYFIGITGDKNDSQVQISNAWFVGQKNYLRAWAYIHSLGINAKEWNPPIEWIQMTTHTNTQITASEFATNRSSSNIETDAKSTSERKRTADFIEPNIDLPSSPKSTFDIYDSTHNATIPSTDIILGVGGYLQNCHNFDLLQDIGIFLPFVPIQHITILDILGSGRNGSTFLVTWNDMQYAMKQYDVGKNRDNTRTYFKNEMLAYRRLQTVWGTLVPKPIFISESLSGGVLFFGIQLGRKITEEDMSKPDFVIQFKEIFERLKKEYNIEHNDIDRTNTIYITDSETGVEKLVVIDFEDWYDL